VQKYLGFFSMGIGVIPIPIYVHFHSFPPQFPSWSLVPIPVGFYGNSHSHGIPIPNVISGPVTLAVEYWSRISEIPRLIIELVLWTFPLLKNVLRIMFGTRVQFSSCESDTRCKAKPNFCPPGCATSQWRDENPISG